MEDGEGRTGRLSAVLPPRHARFALTSLLIGTTNGASPRAVPHLFFLPAVGVVVALLVCLVAARPDDATERLSR